MSENVNYIDKLEDCLLKYKKELFFSIFLFLFYLLNESNIQKAVSNFCVNNSATFSSFGYIKLIIALSLLLLIISFNIRRLVKNSYHFSSTQICVILNVFIYTSLLSKELYNSLIKYNEELSLINCGLYIWVVFIVFTYIISCPFRCKKREKEAEKKKRTGLLSDKEVESYKDLFPSRQQLVRNLCDEIVAFDCSRSISIGINSPWGNGKSSVINGLKDYICNGQSALENDINFYPRDLHKDIIWVDYRPWFAKNVDDVSIHFINTLAFKLKPYHGGLASSLKRYKQLLMTIDNGYLGKIWNSFDCFFDENRDLEAQFKLVDDSISKIGRKVVVAMDDLDRLTGDELMACLKILRVTGSFKNVIFLVAYDPEYVRNQIAVKMSVNEVQSRRYLEKFFQLSINLPEVSKREKRKLLWNILSDKLKENGRDENITELEFESYFTFGQKLRNHLRNYSLEQKNKNELEENDSNSSLYYTVHEIEREFDLIEFLDTPRNISLCANRLSETVSSNLCETEQLLLMKVFMERYPKQAIWISQEIKKSEDLRSLRYRTASDESKLKLISPVFDKEKVAQAIYEIGDYDITYMRFIEALDYNHEKKDIGFHKNYLLYYNLAEQSSFMDDKEFESYLNYLHKLKKLVDSKDEQSNEKKNTFRALLDFELEDQEKSVSTEQLFAVLMLDEKRLEEDGGEKDFLNVHIIDRFISGFDTEKFKALYKQYKDDLNIYVLVKCIVSMVDYRVIEDYIKRSDKYTDKIDEMVRSLNKILVEFSVRRGRITIEIQLYSRVVGYLNNYRKKESDLMKMKLNILCKNIPSLEND
ncbi:KAP family NTPase [Halosquirtibacter xylanolyticus]|uniref:KAP family P-loop NTPase fold protein n=1 Tax=Halosquirtibacter xylanolyticus TaxID=3374599 RepID=UPI00374829FE|nr:KAP family NTPase [Prolixibacteraceae bacterium]